METFDREILKTALENFIESWINLAKESTDTVLETLNRIENADFEKVVEN